MLADLTPLPLVCGFLLAKWMPYSLLTSLDSSRYAKIATIDDIHGIRKEKTTFYRCHTFLMLSLLLQNIVSSSFHHIFPNTFSSSLCVWCVHDISIQQRHYYSSMTEQWRWKSNKSFAFTSHAIPASTSREIFNVRYMYKRLLIWCTVREVSLLIPRCVVYCELSYRRRFMTEEDMLSLFWVVMPFLVCHLHLPIEFEYLFDHEHATATVGSTWS